MADIYEQISKFDELINFVENQLPEFAKQVLSADLVALVTNRVVQRGEDYTGVRFSAYSVTTVAAYRFWGKSRTQAAEKIIRAKARAKGALSYKEFRGINNLKTDKKNFEFTGEMWKKFGVIRSVVSGSKFTVSIGGTTTASQNKIDDNSQREGLSIIEASDDERDLVSRTTEDWISQHANRILNG